MSTSTREEYRLVVGLPKGQYPRIAAAITEFVTSTLPGNPARMSKPLRGELEGLRSARRGDYRVLFSLDEATSTQLVVRVAHRPDVYRHN